jgi:hypothetical protein
LNGPCAFCGTHWSLCLGGQSDQQNEKLRPECATNDIRNGKRTETKNDTKVPKKKKFTKPEKNRDPRSSCSGPPGCWWLATTFGAVVYASLWSGLSELVELSIASLYALLPRRKCYLGDAASSLSTLAGWRSFLVLVVSWLCFRLSCPVLNAGLALTASGTRPTTVMRHQIVSQLLRQSGCWLCLVGMAFGLLRFRLRFGRLENTLPSPRKEMSPLSPVSSLSPLSLLPCIPHAAVGRLLDFLSLALILMRRLAFCSARHSMLHGASCFHCVERAWH